jgi:O-antigen/teichoic acid export membrane protein
VDIDNDSLYFFIQTKEKIEMSHEKFMNSSIFLFLDLIVVAAGGWLYWLVISKLVSVSDVGQSTAVYSLVVLIGSIVGLGLEYPLLKKSSTAGSTIVGSAILIELTITIAVVPFIIYTLEDLHLEALQSYTMIALVMLISISQGYVARYALLGISASKTILVIDTISTGVKFVAGYFLVLSGFGALGVLLSFMLQALLTACIALSLVHNIFGFNLGGFKYIKDTFKEGIVNMPSIFSRTLIVSLSVVLLASFGIASSEIGIFYIALMISVVAGGLISSMAYMVIPASSMTQTDLTSGSIRIGISLTAPIIALLLTSPHFVLSLIGIEYVSGQILLMILGVGILPFAVATNTVSRFNYLGMSRRLLFIGLLQMIGFIVSFILLVPPFKVVGAALSILISYSVSCIPALIWSEKILLRYIANTAIAIIAGWGISTIVKLSLPDGIINEITTLLTSIVVTMVIIVALKNTSISEVRRLLKTVVNPTTSK